MVTSLIELISRTLIENNFEAIFNVPGFGGSEVTNDLIAKGHRKTFVNLNEEAAFSVAYGVSFCGKRSALLIKSQGFTKAMNALTSSLSTELRAANLVFVFDDTEGRSSDNILPTKAIIKGSEVPFVILNKDPSQEIAKAVSLSEKLKLPVAIYVDCKKLTAQYKLKIKHVSQRKTKNTHLMNRVACPILTNYQRKNLKNRLGGRSIKIPIPKITDVESILPVKLLTEFKKYVPVMTILKEERPDFIAGDAGTSGLYAFSPYECIDSCTYMGGGPGMAAGALIAGVYNPICVTGDFSFLSAGVLGLQEAINCEIPVKIIIFNNGKAHATGGQKINPVLMENFKQGYAKYIKNIKLSEQNKILKKEIRDFLKSKGTAILIVEV